MIAELLLALLLLTVAVSSLAALMYTVTHRSEASREPIGCVSKGTAPGKCATPSPASKESKLLRSGCATQVSSARPCKDTAISVDSSDEAIIRPRTDSAAMAALAKNQKPRSTQRPDRGFIR